MSLESLKLLLVDDNEHMRMLLIEILRAAGVSQVAQAGDGKEALQLLQHHAVDIIMTDLAMAPMDGVKFVRLLRTDAASPAPYCPVIMISGHTSERRIFEARDAGVNEFLTKPVTVRAVLGRIEQIINHPRPYVRSNDYFGPDRRRRQKPGYSGPCRRSLEGPLQTVLD